MKSLHPDEVRALGAKVVLGNAYHLHFRPGEDVVERLGGIHVFSGWSGPILTDSGGFQVFSLRDTIRSLDVQTRQLKQLLFEREGAGLSYPALVITADSASYSDSLRAWRLRNGASRVIAGPGTQATFEFRTLRLRALTQAPADLLAEPKAPDEMRYAELRRYIDALHRLAK